MGHNWAEPIRILEAFCRHGAIATDGEDLEQFFQKKLQGPKQTCPTYEPQCCPPGKKACGSGV